MANICCVSMRIYGALNILKKVITEVIEPTVAWDTIKGKVLNMGMLSTESEYKEINVVEDVPNWGYIDYLCECKWSVKSSMLTAFKDICDLYTLTKLYPISIEYYSEECGMGFQEHGIIYKGDFYGEEEVIDYMEIDVEDYKEDDFDKFFEENFAEEENIVDKYGVDLTTLKALFENSVECGEYLRLGGFSDWEFDNKLHYKLHNDN